jgi:hypothetical protein
MLPVRHPNGQRRAPSPSPSGRAESSLMALGTPWTVNDLFDAYARDFLPLKAASTQYSDRHVLGQLRAEIGTMWGFQEHWPENVR